MGSRPQGKSVRFAVFELWLETGELFKVGRRIRLQEKPFRMLAALLDRPGEMVTREELHRRIWPEEAYLEFDKGLNVAVHKLRLCLGDSAEKPHLIETLAGRGYRFIGDITPNEFAPQTLNPPVWLPNGILARIGKRQFAVRAAVALAIMILATSSAWRRPGVAPRKVVAVLPLSSSAVGMQEGHASAMTYALIAALSDCGSLRVVSAASSARSRGSNKSLHEIAKELGVDAVLEGSFAEDHGKVSVTAHLIEATKDRSLWGGHFERSAPAAGETRVELAAVVARNVKFALLRPGEKPPGETGTFFSNPGPPR